MTQTELNTKVLAVLEEAREALIGQTCKLVLGDKDLREARARVEDVELCSLGGLKFRLVFLEQNGFTSFGKQSLLFFPSHMVKFDG